MTYKNQWRSSLLHQKNYKTMQKTMSDSSLVLCNILAVAHGRVTSTILIRSLVQIQLPGQPGIAQLAEHKTPSDCSRLAMLMCRKGLIYLSLPKVNHNPFRLPFVLERVKSRSLPGGVMALPAALLKVWHLLIKGQIWTAANGLVTSLEKKVWRKLNKTRSAYSPSFLFLKGSWFQSLKVRRWGYIHSPAAIF